MNIPDKRINQVGKYSDYKEAQFNTRKKALTDQINLIKSSSLTKQDKDILLLELTSIIKGVIIL
jgi:hypothetical protein